MTNDAKTNGAMKNGRAPSANGRHRQRPRAITQPTLGMLEWFTVGEHERVERLLDALDQLGVDHLRTGVSWADWHTEQGEEWYDWLLPRLAQQVEVLPCFLYTPPSLGIEPRTSSPPRHPKMFADFLDQMITRYGDTFEWVELWNEPTNLSEWDFTIDPSWNTFCQMITGAAYWAHQRGKKTVLAGMGPIDPNFLRMMFDRGVMEHIDAVGVHGFPGVWEQAWDGWPQEIAGVRAVLDEHDHGAEIWITETGFSTWQHDEKAQVEAFVDALHAPVDRLYWYAAQDLAEERETIDGFHLDEREYHFGLVHSDGRPKLLFRLWAEGGIDAVEEIASLRPTVTEDDAYVLITGGAGFVGTNLADCYLREGKKVMIYDNLSRPGVEKNLDWLRDKHGERVLVKVADVRNPYQITEAVSKAEAVYHFAGQVAVTTSLDHPVEDFEINARGTLNVLEALRRQGRHVPMLFTSTNKVYGDLVDLKLRCAETRYEQVDTHLSQLGVTENRSLAFHSPYGCSKGAADQYVLDYAQSYGLPTAVFRMSCIYGPHQFGTEDQGWVAHFLISAIEDETITIYGDGKQVRDVLFVEDLMRAFRTATDDIDSIAGEAFNIGGGPHNSISLLELIQLIEAIQGRAVDLQFDEWRRGDQRYYVSNIGKFSRATGWEPRVGIREGIYRLYRWLCEERGVPAPTYHPNRRQSKERATAPVLAV